MTAEPDQTGTDWNQTAGQFLNWSMAVLAVSCISISIINFTRTNVKRPAYLKITMLSPDNCGKKRRKKKKS
jgi:hypothetical protein